MQLWYQIRSIRYFVSAKAKRFAFTLAVLEYRFVHVFSCARTCSQIFSEIRLMTIAEGSLTMRELAIVGVEGDLASRFYHYLYSGFG